MKTQIMQALSKEALAEQLPSLTHQKMKETSTHKHQVLNNQ